MSYKKQEQKMLQRIIDSGLIDGIEPKFGMSVYDAYSPEALIELKYRKTDYPTYFVERKKMRDIVKYLKSKEQHIYYACTNPTDTKIYIFDIIQLVIENYDFGWYWKDLPDGTHVKSKGMNFVKKEIAELPKELAHYVIE